MASPEGIAALRARAQILRNFALQVRNSPVMALLPHADLATWDSPRAEACRQQLQTQIAAAHQACEELDFYAQRLEQHALEMEHVLAQQLAVASRDPFGSEQEI
jgi:hypothetical protein